MTHLTVPQILQFLDGTADYATQAQCTNHLAVCGQCRREVEVHKKLSKASKQNPFATSARFTERVMSRIAPELRTSWSSRILNNVAGAFAMMVVLGVFGYVVTSTSDFKLESSPEYSTMAKSFTESYAKLKKSVQEETDKMAVKTKASPSSNSSQRIILFAFLALLTLGVIDRFVLRQLMKTKL